MSEALWLFRDFVEKLERAYIAFDGVVGSCLGRAWGGTNHGMEDDDVDVIPRNSESNIAERASFSLPIGLLFRPYLLSFPNTSLVYLYLRILYLFLFSPHLAYRFPGRREGKKFNSLSIVHESEISLFVLHFCFTLYRLFSNLYLATFLPLGLLFSGDISSGMGKRL